MRAPFMFTSTDQKRRAENRERKLHLRVSAQNMKISKKIFEMMNSDRNLKELGKTNFRNYNEVDYRRLQRARQRRQMMRITFENLSLLQKLEMSKSLYSKKRLMSKEIERIEKLERVCEFPLVVERPVLRKKTERGRNVKRRQDLAGLGNFAVPHSSLNHHMSFYDDEDVRLEAAARESGQIVKKKVAWNVKKRSNRKVNYKNGRKIQAKSHGGGFFVRVSKGKRRRSEGRMLLGNKSLAVRRKHRKGNKSLKVKVKSPKRNTKGMKRDGYMPEIGRVSDEVRSGQDKNKRSLKKKKIRISGSPEAPRRLNELMEENRAEDELRPKFGNAEKRDRPGAGSKGTKRIKIKGKGKRKRKVKVGGIKVDNFFIRPKVKKNRGKNKKRKIVLPNIRAKTEKTENYGEEKDKVARISSKSEERETSGQTLSETDVNDNKTKEPENLGNEDEMKVKKEVEFDKKMGEEVDVAETEMAKTIAEDEEEDRKKRNERANLIVNNDTMNQMISQTQPENEDEQLMDLSEANTPDLEEDSKSSKSSQGEIEKPKSVKSEKSIKSNKSESDRSSKSHSKKSDKSVSVHSSKSGSDLSSKSHSSKSSKSSKSDSRDSVKSKSDLSSKSQSKKTVTESKDSYDDIFDKAETIDEQSKKNEKSNGSDGQEENFGSNFNKNFTKFYAKKE